MGRLHFPYLLKLKEKIIHHFPYRPDLGLYDLRSGTDQLGQGGRTHPATVVYVSPSYKSSNVDYDIALIRTYEPFEFGDTRQPVTLSTSEPNVGDVLFVSGWGLTNVSIASVLN